MLLNKIFKWFNKGTLKFRPQDKAIITIMLKQYMNYSPKHSAFLYLLDIDHINYVWMLSDSTCDTNGIMGKFTPMAPNRILLKDTGGFYYDSKTGEVTAKCNIMSPVTGTVIGKDRILPQVVATIFPTCVHELLHMVQFGWMCKVPNPTWKDIVLFKVILPIGYVYNRLITLFIDNAIVDGIIKWIYRNNFEVNPEKIHMPFFYKFTLEYLADKDSELCDDLINYAKMIEAAIQRISWIELNDPYTNQKRFVNYSPEDMEFVKQNYIDLLEQTKTEFPEPWMTWAREIVDAYDKINNTQQNKK